MKLNKSSGINIKSGRLLLGRPEYLPEGLAEWLVGRVMWPEGRSDQTSWLSRCIQAQIQTLPRFLRRQIGHPRGPSIHLEPRENSANVKDEKLKYHNEFLIIPLVGHMNYFGATYFNLKELSIH